MKIDNGNLSTVFLEQNMKTNNVKTSNAKASASNVKIKENTLSDNNSSSLRETTNYKVSEKAISKAVDNVNKKLDKSNTECKFSVHKATGQITVKVMDKETGDVIKEIPSEKILDIVATALEMAGILMDEKR